MNLFRFAGDILHLLSILVLLLKIHATKSCAGISLKTQELYLAVFITRYLDLFWNFHSLYNSVFKVVYIGTTSMIVWYMRRHRNVKLTYDRDHDTFRYLFLVAPCAVLSLLINARYNLFEILWTFSIYLEAVAILPQLVLLQRTKNVDNLTGNYVFLLGLYRAFYILNWVYRFATEPGYSAWLVWISGLIQTGLYLDFFYYYVQAWKQSKKLQLPS
ncbi:ER lumen protein-retaining receptor [Chloropicon primus]|uniref:ER lumen protein-retaining receptor n=1 Tax=Chloropicon primus TaxID=1764295 RepID=A0A5B8MLT9_9CHLO|nr:ER lumen protein-retaining receptor [Chloropicon primus]UPR00623.1 ER lumen protein-retaining receptor [Chloropicon primus]|mmetsp:Transcript_2734/g.7505  ORF Transcript_2734/g.7505 Transcript_2734/m.7505 type:complete len:216 (+) Transcript_2734:410-1057(+)|eukprot:QDZ21409.1 ER lumen protein-retaining receptor [Chloropicon primus]